MKTYRYLRGLFQASFSLCSIAGLLGGYNEPYIFCYFLGNNPPHRKFVKRLSEKTGYKIVALIHLDEYVKSDENFADISPFDVDPSDFLNLIKNASFVCTDSFHCSVFSMLYKRIFFTFRRYSRQTKSSTNTRLDTLFSLAGITDGIFVSPQSCIPSIL